MRVRYASYSAALKWALRLIDGVLALLCRRRRPLLPGRPVERILLANQAHLGDAILATAVLAPLRRRFPHASLGFLVHPGARQVVDNHPDVSWVHTVEHWHLNRSERSFWRRLWRHRQTSRTAVSDIRAVDYQLAIDLHPYFPNSIPLLWRCGIPRLLGWTSGGFGPLLDQSLSDETNQPGNMLHRHARMLQLLGLEIDVSQLRPAPALPDSAQQAWAALAKKHEIGERYVAFHVGAHVAHRRWPVARWVEVAAELSQRGFEIVLLGHGAKEVELCRQINQACQSAVDLGGQLAWGELVAAIAGCALLISHDSAATHLAAAFDKPRICIATGIHDLRVWLRESERSVVLTKPVDCAPCGRVGGCSTMECIRGVSTTSVVAAALTLADPNIANLPQTPPPSQ